MNDRFERDAHRYRRLRILGCAPGGSKHLDNGTVLRFQNLDEYVDTDLANYDRGEAPDGQTALIDTSEAYTRADARELARLALQLLAAYEQVCAERDEETRLGAERWAKEVSRRIYERDQFRALLASIVERWSAADNPPNITAVLSEIATAAGLAKGDGDE